MRRRRSPADEPSEVTSDAPEKEKAESIKNKTVQGSPSTAAPLSFRVAKWAILRLISMVYLIAFLGAYFQNQGLMGTHGIQPAADYMDRLQSNYASPWQGFRQHPSIFWWIPLTDATMNLVALIGMLISTVVLLGINSWLCMFVLWLLDFSIVTMAQHTSFYSYGWESQLLETGFLAIFLCDLPHVTRNDAGNYKSMGLWRDAERNSPPSLPILWLFRWLCFRISVGAGLIKLRGSSCWTTKTCLWYHFETQPIPSPLSFVFHFLPKSVLTRAVDLDLWVQVYTSWFVLVPSWTWYTSLMRRLGGWIQAGFMINIIASGNFAFLNHLTVIPALACLDDDCWPRVLTTWVCRGNDITPTPRRNRFSLRVFVDILLVLLIGALSLPVVTNLLQWRGSRQVMNASFDRFRLVNTYGAFGSVGQARYEPIVSVSMDGGVEWTELEFPCKPGNIKRRPCFCAPYHYRLDWNIWFLGFKPHRRYLQQRESWLYTLIGKILDNSNASNDDRPWLDLLDATSSRQLREIYASPQSIQMMAKVEMWKYQMTGSLWSVLKSKLLGNDVAWWERTWEETLIPPVQLGKNGRLEMAKLPESQSQR